MTPRVGTETGAEQRLMRAVVYKAVWCDRPTSHSTDTCIHQHYTDSPQQLAEYINT